MLMDAALEICGTQGWSATTMTAVCSRARLTERYFYESFADRDELLVAVFDRIAGEAAEVVLAATEAAPDAARERTRAAVTAFVELMTDDPRKGRVAFVEAMGSEALMRRRFESIGTFAGLLAEQARVYYGTGEEAERILQVTSFLLVGGLAETLIAWLRGEVASSREELIGDVTDLFVATGEAAVGIAGRRAGG
jgi:AcrR family transcriptional regulator